MYPYMVFLGFENISRVGVIDIEKLHFPKYYKTAKERNLFCCFCFLTRCIKYHSPSASKHRHTPLLPLFAQAHLDPNHIALSGYTEAKTLHIIYSL